MKRVSRRSSTLTIFWFKDQARVDGKPYKTYLLIIMHGDYGELAKLGLKKGDPIPYKSTNMYGFDSSMTHP